MKINKLIVIASCLFLMVCTGCSKNENNGTTILVGAASSLTDVLTEMEPVFEKETGIKLDLQLSASGPLKEQVKSGAPIDVVVLASKKDMDELKSANLVVEMKVLLTNQLVLIRNKEYKINNLDELVDVTGYIAIGEPSSVPAGKYGVEALKNLGLYDSLKDSFTYGKDVSQILNWVELGSADVGFVYYSDYVRSRNVEVVEVIDDSMYSKILYPAALVKTTSHKDEARRFMEFLMSDKARSLFEKYGFINLDI